MKRHCQYNHTAKALFILLLVTLAGTVRSQERPQKVKSNNITEKELVLYDDSTLVRDIGWVRAHFLDNWFVQLSPLGASMYHGYGDNAATLPDRFTWHGNAYIGRWVFPMLGVRLGGGYGYSRGFLSLDDYRRFGGADGTAYGWGQCGDADLGDGTVRGLGGYYHLFDEQTLVQKWRYYYANADAMVNLSYIKSYNPKRPFMTMLYAGVGVYFGLSEGYEGASGVVLAESDPNRSLEIHAGIVEQFQLSERWRFYADLRVSAMQRTFDREWIQAAERPLDVADIMTTLHIGVQYNFNLRKEAKRNQWYKETINSEFDGDHAPHYALATQSVRYTKHINYIDTMFVYDTVNTDLAKIIMKNAEDSIAAARKRFEKECEEATLNDILGNHLLPYEMVFFELDKWDILSSENLKVAKMATLIKKFPEYKFLLIGSADAKTGTEKRNNYLSHQRADVVYNKLVMDYGINPKQLERVYLGGIRDYEPYQLNRATVIIIKHEKVIEEFKKLKAK